MRAVSAAFYDAIKNDRRDYLERVTMTLADSTVLNITNEHIWQNGLSFEDAVSDENSFQIGAVIINKATIVLNNIYDDFDDYDFVGASVVIELGLSLNGTDEYIKIGTYTVLDEPKRNGSFITIECLDNMYKFDRPYSESTLVYPAYESDVVRDICNSCGVVFNRRDVESGYSQHTLMKPVGDKLTFREVLSYAVQVSGNDYAKCNPDGELVISHFYYLKKKSWPSALLSKYPPYYPYVDTTKTVSGITFTDNGDGTITVNGTNTSSSVVSFTISNLYSGNNFKYGKYKVSGCPVGSTSSNYYMQITVGNSSGSGSVHKVVEGGRTVTLSGTNTSIPWMSIVVGAGVTVNNAVFAPKIEREDGGIPENRNIQYLTNLFGYNISNKDIEVTGARIYADFTDDSGRKYNYNESIGTDECEVVIANNPLLQYMGVRGSLSNFGEGHIGMKYRKADITHSSDPTIEAGDVGVVIDRKGNRYPVLVSSTKFTVGNTQRTVSAADENTLGNTRQTIISQAVYEKGNEKVSKNGDTMLGDLQFFNEEIDDTQTELDTPIEDKFFAMTEAHGRRVGYLDVGQKTDGTTFLGMAAERLVGSSSITNGIEFRIAPDGTKSLVITDPTLWREALNAVNKAGDTMTGSLTISSANLLIKSTNMTVGTTPSSTAWGRGCYFRDSANTDMGYIRLYINKVGTVHMQYETTRTVNGTAIFNNLTLGISSSGSRTVSVSEAAPWRSAIGAVNKAGDTMTGNLHVHGASAYVQIRATNYNTKIGATTPSSNSSVGGLQFEDSQGVANGWVRSLLLTNGRLQTEMYCRRKNASGTDLYNYVAVGIDASGNPTVSMTSPSAWRTALDLKNQIVKRSVSGSINKAYGNKVSLTAPTVSGYTFLCWYAYPTDGWIGAIYPQNPNSATTNFWNATYGQSGTGTVYAYALYIRND